MKNKTKHLVSFCVLVIFAFFAVSSRVNKIHNGAFNYRNKVEEPSDNCLVKNDGTKVYGKKILWNTGVLARKSIKIDDQRFPFSEIKGYYQNGAYYGFFRGEYGQRIIHGKINVYVQFKQITSTSTNGNGFTSSHSYLDAFHYAQMGEDGPMVPLARKGDIKKMLEACPLAVDMFNNRSHKQKKDPNFLNHVFDTYNAGCKEPADKD